MRVCWNRIVITCQKLQCIARLHRCNQITKKIVLRPAAPLTNPLSSTKLFVAFAMIGNTPIFMSLESRNLKCKYETMDKHHHLFSLNHTVSGSVLTFTRGIDIHRSNSCVLHLRSMAKFYFVRRLCVLYSQYFCLEKWDKQGCKIIKWVNLDKSR